MKFVDTKSTNIGEIKVNLNMFSTSNLKNLIFKGPPGMEITYYDSPSETF